jgi:hypothetical protein
MKTRCPGQLCVASNVVAALFVVALVGCRAGPTVPSRTSTPPLDLTPIFGPVSAGIFTLSGTVYESAPAGVRPLAGVPLDVSVEYQSWPPRTTSDSEGHYQLSVFGTQKLKVAAKKEGYAQPCRAAVDVTRDSVLDVYLVPAAVLAQSGIPASMPIVEPTLSGFVVERTATGVTPVAEVPIVADFSGLMSWAPSATTVTDAAGRYFLCNVIDATRFGLALGVGKSPTYPNDYFVLPNPFPAHFDIEVVPGQVKR